MIAADNQQDRALAELAYAANSSIEAPDLPSALLQSNTTLIFHSIFGEYSDAMVEIERLSRLVEASEPCWEATATRANIVLARTIVDPADIDLSDLKRAFEECRSAQMTRMAISIAGRIASCLIDSGEIAEAAKWVSSAEPLLSQIGIERPAPDFVSCQADLAHLAGDAERAGQHVRAMSDSMRSSASPIFSDFLLLHRLRHQQFTSDQPIAPRDLEWVLDRHSRARTFGRHDDYMDVLWTALTAAGRQAEASAILFEYLTISRRERRPGSHFLRTRSASDPAWSHVKRLPEGGYIPIDTSSARLTEFEGC
jgi:hypothetical protein